MDAVEKKKKNNIRRKEFQAVEMLLETGEFDTEMDINEKKSNASKNVTTCVEVQ